MAEYQLSSRIAFYSSFFSPTNCIMVMQSISFPFIPNLFSSTHPFVDPMHSIYTTETNILSLHTPFSLLNNTISFLLHDFSLHFFTFFSSSSVSVNFYFTFFSFFFPALSFLLSSSLYFLFYNALLSFFLYVCFSSSLTYPENSLLSS